MDTKEEREEPTCLLAHPTHPHTLSRRDRSPSHFKLGCYSCGKQEAEWLYKPNFDYYCTKCDVEFHLLCSPRHITHPYHLQHPLTLISQNYHTDIGEQSASGDIIQSQSNTLFTKCSWCEEDIKSERFYRCAMCNFCLDLSCVSKYPPLTIENPKSHHHSLSFFTRPLLVPCDACGLINKTEPSYTCFQCNYVVHQGCVNLPRVIKITRHPHHLSYTPFLPPTKIPSCRICYKTVDIKYGQYSCKNEDCFYVVHSKCATRSEVWNGRELEWELDESEDKAEDIAPFTRVDVDMIKHFAHEHLLKVEKYNECRDAEKQCQACVLRIDSRDFYNCVQCGFYLHEVCANLPRKLDHAFHRHPLFLDPSPLDEYYSIRCSICWRSSSGFWYTCLEKGCMESRRRFQIDVCCILVPEYFKTRSHDHPLFLMTSFLKFHKIPCNNCATSHMGSHLQCLVCEIALCYKCATIPNEVHYKYDEHPLLLCGGESGKYWCEKCEKGITNTEWFYECNKCDITIHTDCTFGFSVYMNPSYIFEHKSTKVEVVNNSSSTRPVCHQCGCRCSASVYFKQDNVVACSFYCLDRY